eukprot:TRINITY_DN245_c0_g1_i10.p1 TRINITY_DN245_c0_g1~~TRINITY_DN245_c0_g1_i10.p1  ORF type:complete len:510 (-),score=167.80 TRINITY_DN245_c0_g1_i10:126-1655(-)
MATEVDGKQELNFTSEIGCCLDKFFQQAENVLKNDQNAQDRPFQLFSGHQMATGTYSLATRTDWGMFARTESSSSSSSSSSSQTTSKDLLLINAEGKWNDDIGNIANWYDISEGPSSDKKLKDAINEMQLQTIMGNWYFGDQERHASLMILFTEKQFWVFSRMRMDIPCDGHEEDQGKVKTDPQIRTFPLLRLQMPGSEQEGNEEQNLGDNVARFESMLVAIAMTIPQFVEEFDEIPVCSVPVKREDGNPLMVTELPIGRNCFLYEYGEGTGQANQFVKVYDYYWREQDGRRTANQDIVHKMVNWKEAELSASQRTFYSSWRYDSPMKDLGILQYNYVEGGHTTDKVSCFGWIVRIVGVLHEHGYVFGDIRQWNMVFCDENPESSVLIDWDFVDKEGARYSSKMMDIPERHPEAKAETEMKKEHDRYSLGIVFNKLFTAKEGEGEEKEKEILKELETGNLKEIAERMINEEFDDLFVGGGETEELPVVTGSPPRKEGKGKEKENEDDES